MKLKVEKAAVVEGLQKVVSIVSTRTTLPILSNVLLQAEGGKLHLTSTDLEVSVKTSVDASVSKKGGTTLPARRLASIIRELASHDVEITIEDKDTAVIQAGPSFFKLRGASEDDFPPLPKFEGSRAFTLKQGVFRDMLVKTSYAASTDETRYILNGVLLSFRDEKLTVVATDGRRLALVEQEVEFPKDSEGDLVIPTKTVNELIRTLQDDGSIRIQASANQVAFEFGDMLIISKLIEGAFPNFRQVIPSQAEQRVTIEREALMNAVRRVALLASEQASTVRLTFANNRLEITAETPDVGEARETLPVKFSAKEITVAFNPEFIVAPLKTLDSDEVFFEVTDALSPGVIKSNVPFLYVLMPMRIN